MCVQYMYIYYARIVLILVIMKVQSTWCYSIALPFWEILHYPATLKLERFDYDHM